MSSLPALQAGVPIVDQTGSPTQFFLTYLQQITSGLSNSSGASMPAPSPVTIYYDYSGTTTTDLPYPVRVQRFLNGDDVSAKSRWFLSAVSGTITATIDQTGIVTITALGVSSVLQVKSVRDGVTLTCNLTVNKSLGGAPSGGGSGAVNTSTFNSINSTVYAQITTDLTVTVGSSGTVTLNAPLTVTTDRVSPIGTFAVFGKWQWFNGSSWVDVATEVQSSPDCDVEYEPPYVVDPGSLTVNTAQTGLTVGSSQKFHLMARKDAGTRTMYFNGTASVIP